MSCALTLALNTYSAESVSYPNTFEVEQLYCVAIRTSCVYWTFRRMPSSAFWARV
jgi:hypothetical protein